MIIDYAGAGTWSVRTGDYYYAHQSAAAVLVHLKAYDGRTVRYTDPLMTSVARTESLRLMFTLAAADYRGAASNLKEVCTNHDSSPTTTRAVRNCGSRGRIASAGWVLNLAVDDHPHRQEGGVALSATGRSARPGLPRV